MNSFLEVRGVHKSFGSGDARVDVLKGIDLEFAEGETIALVGASGAGKSTLLHILGTLDRPSSGSVLFQGEDVFKTGDQGLASFRNRSIGFVFQFHHLLPEFTAVENVMMPLLISGGKRIEAAEVASQLLRDVGLGHRFSHRPGELSGGEQQRVAIARALVGSPQLLLADEPTGNLDMKTSDEIHGLLGEIHASRRLTMIIVTHNERLAGRMGRTIRLVDGRIGS
ncbi:lipoprotein-releasing system ATP-binding protein LolD [Geobacter sp. OR-1]|uniref:ABC transporter ATP-binding protein n=1 Tax=Geobacter sp. OR-1 TaxID=1266765 RepID=UPI000541E04A|nr:ABC transporter ATP-binding protein [Geobacter sp. OR-1]GAM07944.1 lipoprotein-releasing system ATP-binding protein LolD [Geobacter sp. OR-1]